MSLYICDKCHAIENTALGWYWSRRNNQRMLGPEYPKDMALCSECCPATFADGSPLKDGGKWHEVFPKKIADAEYVLKKITLDKRGKIIALQPGFCWTIGAQTIFDGL